MNRLEQLINEFCPNGVDFVRLDAVCKVYDGTHSTPKYTDNGVKFVSVQNINDLYATDKYISVDDFKKYKNTPRVGDVLMTRIGSIGVCAVVDRDEPLAYYVSLALLKPNQKVLNSKYLKYAIESLNGRKELRKRTLINAVPIKINKEDIGKIVIPIPPLPVQKEIICILDNLTESTEKLAQELNAELTARKQQYEYYRDCLLTFGNDTKFKQFGEIASIVRGASPRPIKNFITSDAESVNWIKIGDVKPGSKYITETAEKISIDGAKKSRFVKEGDFILSNSMSFGRPYIMKTQGCIHDGWLAISDFEKTFVPDFLYHLLSSNKYQQMMKQKASFGGAVQNLNADIVRSFDMPIIELEIQRDIVKVLDDFDKQCNDITKILSNEIEVRKKQYEYYRDKLLTFKEKEATNNE